MKTAREFSVVLVTAPNLKASRTLAKAVLHHRLAACVNIVPRVESHYWWKGKVDTGGELLLIIKTRKSRLPGLEECIRRNHPYDTPEFLVLPLVSGNQKYLDWLHDSVG